MTSLENGSPRPERGSEHVEIPTTSPNRPSLPSTSLQSTSLQSNGLRSQWMRWLKWLIAIVVIIGLAATINSAVRQWREQPPETRISLLNLDRTSLGVAALLYSLGIAISFLVVRQAIKALGYRAPWHVVLAAQVLGHLGKYVPGKAVVVVLRVGALSTHGVPSVPATISVFVETLTMLAVGSALACSLVFTVPLPDWIRIGAVLMAITATIPTLPPILRRIAGRLTRTEVNLRGAAGWWLYVVSLFWSAISWLLIGGSLAAVVMSIPHNEIPHNEIPHNEIPHNEMSAGPWPAPLELYWISTAAIGLAFSIGFVSLLPGGAGVRELVLVSMLAQSIGTPQALVATILLRFLFIVVESILALFAYIWLRQIVPTSEESHSNEVTFS